MSFSLTTTNYCCCFLLLMLMLWFLFLLSLTHSEFWVPCSSTTFSRCNIVVVFVSVSEPSHVWCERAFTGPRIYRPYRKPTSQMWHTTEWSYTQNVDRHLSSVSLLLHCTVGGKRNEIPTKNPAQKRNQFQCRGTNRNSSGTTTLASALKRQCNGHPRRWNPVRYLHMTRKIPPIRGFDAYLGYIRFHQKY